MPLISRQILSSDNKFPFSDSIEKFFNTYHIEEGVEVYYMYPAPKEYNIPNSTSAEDLNSIKYKEKLIIWALSDSFIDLNSYNYYKQDKPKEIQKLENICKDNKEKIFLLCSNLYNLNIFLSADNLFSLDNLINTKFVVKYRRCLEKNFTTKKQWICLNHTPKPHRMALVSYLLGMGLDEFGTIVCNNSLNTDTNDTYNYNLILDYFKFNDVDKKNIRKVLFRLNIQKFEKINIINYEKLQNNILPEYLNYTNYHDHILPIYKHTALEIISCTLFSEPTPLFGEKEIHSVYGKNFQIFIGSKGTAYKFKHIWGMDIFEDIINHSYDNIEDPTQRLKSAIDMNMHLLDGTTDLSKLWYKNQHRLDKNCDTMDKILYDKNYQLNFDFNKIKVGLDKFGIRYKNKF